MTPAPGSRRDAEHRENIDAHPKGLPGPRAAWDPAVVWLARLLLVGLLLGIAWWIVTGLAGVLVPVFVGLLIAYVTNPVVERLVGRGLPRPMAITVLGLAAVGALVGFFLLVIPAITQEFAAVLERLPQWLESRIEWVVDTAEERFGLSAEQVDEALRELVAELQRWGLMAAQGATESASSILNLILIPIFTFYFLADFRAVVRRPLALVPVRFHAVIVDRATHMDRVVGQWIRGQLKVAAILAVIFSVSLTLLGVKLGFVLGIVAGLLNVIPFVGSFTGGALAVLMVLLEGPPISRVVLVIGLFVVVQTFESYWLTPRIVGSAVGFGPLTIILAILFGGLLFGFLGVLLAVPVTAAGTVLARDALQWLHGTAFWRGGVDDVSDGTDSPAAEMVHGPGSGATEESRGDEAPEEGTSDSGVSEGEGGAA